MKSILIAITLIAVAALAVGCKPSDSQSTSQQLDRGKAETKTDTNPPMGER
jgi:hypothetical protein